MLCGEVAERPESWTWAVADWANETPRVNDIQMKAARAYFAVLVAPFEGGLYMYE